MEISSHFHTPTAFPWKSPIIRWIRRWVGPRGGLDVVVAKKDGKQENYRSKTDGRMKTETRNVQTEIAQTVSVLK